jgi:hypothetical protein
LLASHQEQVSGLARELDTLQGEHDELLASQAKEADALRALQAELLAKKASLDVLAAQRDEVIATQQRATRAHAEQAEKVRSAVSLCFSCAPEMLHEHLKGMHANKGTPCKASAPLF